MRFLQKMLNLIRIKKPQQILIHCGFFYLFTILYSFTNLEEDLDVLKYMV